MRNSGDLRLFRRKASIGNEFKKPVLNNEEFFNKKGVKSPFDFNWFETRVNRRLDPMT